MYYIHIQPKSCKTILYINYYTMTDKKMIKIIKNIITSDITKFLMDILWIVVAISIWTVLARELMVDMLDPKWNSQIICELRK